MRALLLKPLLLVKNNGGDRSIIEYMQWLISRGVNVRAEVALSSGSKPLVRKLLRQWDTPLQDDQYYLGDLPCHLTMDDESEDSTEFFFDLLQKENPEICFAHYTDYAAVCAAVRWNPARTFIFLTDNEFPRQVDLNRCPEIARWYLELQNIIVPSPFLKKSAEAHIPWASTLYIPNIIEDLPRGEVSRRPLYWMFVNPIREKGVEFVLDLARRMPEERFLFVNHWTKIDAACLPANVLLVPQQPHLWTIFAKAKGLLMPSVWQEGFGRIAIEAMAAGVPVIASNHGNLPQTLDYGGRCLPLDLDQWISAMRDLSISSHEQTQLGFQRAASYQVNVERRFSALSRLIRQSEPNLI